ncbi:MAG: M28 family peptidase [Bacteroidetes bacterium]|nr:M28 family peptidase [Bacteroidota bacterium]
MQLKNAILLLFTASSLTLGACHNETKTPPATPPAETKPMVTAPDFNADSAYAFVKAQIDFGPRVPNTNAHIACGDYLIAKMKSWSPNVFVQEGVLRAFDGTNLKFRNIITSFNPDAKQRVLLFAHWDTRPWSDQDSIDPMKPSLGADDGGSGVAVLMEIARQLSQLKPNIGVDLAFFDAEDWGKEGGGPSAEDSYALGTQYWAKNPHVPGYTADYGILLDMVGAKDAQFRFEGLSYERASSVLRKVWSQASQLGYSNYFLNQDGGWITDDHVYVNAIGIPSIDIIHTRINERSGFPSHWHTHRDNLDVIDKNTLKAVGQTLLHVLFQSAV